MYVQMDLCWLDTYLAGAGTGSSVARGMQQTSTLRAASTPSPNFLIGAECRTGERRFSAASHASQDRNSEEAGTKSSAIRTPPHAARWMLPIGIYCQQLFSSYPEGDSSNTIDSDPRCC